MIGSQGTWTFALVGLALGCSSSTSVVEEEPDDGGRIDARAVGGAAGSTRRDASSSGGSGGAALPALDATYSDKITPVTAGQWDNVTNNLAGMSSECSVVVAPSPHVDMIVAAIGKHGIWESNDGGDSWNEFPASDQITSRPTQILHDPTNPGVFWDAGIYNNNGLFKTTDNGNSFPQQGWITHLDSISVDFSDPQRQTLLAGPHEASQKLYLSTDGGQNWDDWGSRLPAGTGFCTEALVLDAQTFLVGCGGWGGGTLGIQRSVNGGSDWVTVYDKAVSDHGLYASDGAIYWAGMSGGLVKSTDKGLTWASVADGATAIAIHPVELPSGKIATVSATDIMVSADKGATWQPVTQGFLPYMPNKPNGIAYSRFRKAFYIWRWDCGPVIESDEIFRFGYE
jgi:photosystem II stability/assembly factor-like uncharacterized protein